MSTTATKTRINRVGFYIALAVIAAIAWQLQSGPAAFFPQPTDKPTEWQQMGVQVAAESTRLLTTLASALFGALGLLLGSAFSKDSVPRQAWSAIVSALCAGLSLFYGHVVHLHLLWMLDNRVFESTNALFVQPIHYQFYSLLAAAFFLAVFAVHNLGGERTT